jgi:hypothetical protein
VLEVPKSTPSRTVMAQRLRARVKSAKSAHGVP